MGLLVKKALEPTQVDVGGMIELMGRTMAALSGASEIPTTRVRVPSGGGRVFGSDDESFEGGKTLTGVIVKAQYGNVYWAHPVGEGDSMPDCASMDGLTGREKDGTEKSCRDCPLNRMGSGAKGKGKACKNIVRLLMLTTAQALPIEIKVPTMSVNNFSRYQAAEIIPRGLQLWQVATELSLKEAVASNGKTKYAQILFECKGRVDDAQIQPLIEGVQSVMALDAPKEQANE